MLSALLTLFIIATITFFLMNVIPGGPFNSERASAKTVAMMESKYGLDKPLFEQYLMYLKRLAHLDLGDSYKRIGFSVNQILDEKFPVSAGVGVVAILLAVLIGVPVGVIQAYYRGGWADNVLRVVTTLGIAMPSFVVATLMLFEFAVALGWLPVQSNSLETFSSYVMPVLTLALNPMCRIAKLTRTSMLDSISQDYIRTARAKGLKTKVILFKHALRNSLIPVITYLGPLTAGIITGALVVEQIYHIPGLGNYFVTSILNRDYPIIMATTVVVSILVIVMNLVVDIAYKIVDPRITLSSTDE